MTDERAIKILSDKIKQMQRYKKPNMGTIDAMVIARDALRQRMPKAVEYGTTKNIKGLVVNHMPEATCPECCKRISWNSEEWELPYCSACGQRLEWRKEKNE